MQRPNDQAYRHTVILEFDITYWLRLFAKPNLIFRRYVRSSAVSG